MVSMLGSAVAGFAMGLLVLDKTDSIALYALFMVFYSLPRIFLPLLSGPILDRFSRKRIIYTLDFVSAGIYLGMFVLLYMGWFSYIPYMLLSMVIGSIDSVYSVAYDSFYPNLVSKGNFQRAYSISSLIYPIAAAIMIPVAGFASEFLSDLSPLFLFNSATFLVAAIFETRIRTRELHVESQTQHRFWSDFREGLAYLKKEKGLSTITTYFFVTTLLGSISGTLLLPYFKTLGTTDVFGFAMSGVVLFSIVMASNTVGRLVGGLVQYFFRYPIYKKFLIAIFVYVTIAVIDGGYLFTPWWTMCILNFTSGLLAVTSYNIRISSTQNYVPDLVRGRFNGVFQMANMAGGIIGQLMAALLGTYFYTRGIVVSANAINIIFVFLIMVPNAKYVKKIYNVQI